MLERGSDEALTHSLSSAAARGEVQMKAWTAQPTLPYKQHYVYAGNSLRLDVTSLDFDSDKETPTALRWRLDNLTNNQAVQDWTSETPADPTVIMISADLNQMDNNGVWPGQDSQQMQVTIEATFTDGSKAQTIVGYSLNAIYRGQT